MEFGFLDCFFFSVFLFLAEYTPPLTPPPPPPRLFLFCFFTISFVC